ncbi:MAG TPA: alpha/beta hydrolase [Stellaceae bacterium]|nr:alpha/beta hydrolase [Stellaceae bacterium]
MPMSTRRISCLGPHGFHRMTYYDRAGPAGAPTVLCVHGLTRNGRDFDDLAQALSAHFRVVCPDVVGRGKSDWLLHGEDYTYPLYLGDMAALIARLDVEEVLWVGTSMGGLIGMLMAATPGSPVKKLVMNDIGPLLAKEGIARIAEYVGKDPSFPNLEALEAYIRATSASFGPLTDEQWRAMATHAARREPDGTLCLAYDPKIADAFHALPKEDIDLWPQWDAITCPTLVLRGAESDLLRAADAKTMTERGPRARLIEYPGIGHAPALRADDQIAAVRDFLLS